MVKEDVEPFLHIVDLWFVLLRCDSFDPGNLWG
jgi:hypothetical protein